MMKRFFILTTLLSSISYFTYAQQDPQISQYIFNGLYINPAYAGYKEVLNMHSFFRSQWTSVPGAPKTGSIAIDGTINQNNVGLAFQLVNDRLGVQFNTSAYASYAYRLRLNDDGTSRLAFGLSAGVTQYGLRATELIFNDTEADINSNIDVILPDARVGIFFSNQQFYAGISADNLIASTYSSAKFNGGIPRPPKHAYLTAGMLVPLSDNILLKPSFLLKEDFAAPTTLDLNAFLILSDKFWIGGSYRTGVKMWNKANLDKNLYQYNAAVAAIEFFPMTNLRIGYAYDFSISPNRTYRGGTHEISIGFYLKQSEVRCYF